MRALLVMLLASLASFPAAAVSRPFAALTVTSDGAQSYDLTTGVTTLPQGGTVVDQDTGVRLHAASLRYREGRTIDGSHATVSGSFGILSADSIHIDIQAGTLTASGQLELTREGLSLQAAKLRYDAGRQVVDFWGPVTGRSPDFEADRVLLDIATGDVLLVGHYRFSDGLVTLSSPRAGGELELHYHLVDGKPFYDAMTEIAPALLARFAPELK